MSDTSSEPTGSEQSTPASGSDAPQNPGQNGQQRPPALNPDGTPRKRRRGSRGGRNRSAASRAANANSPEESTDSVEGAEVGATTAPTTPKPRTNPRRNTTTTEARVEVVADVDVTESSTPPKIGDSRPVAGAEEDGTDPAKKRRRRGGRRRGNKSVATASDETVEDEAIELDAETLEKRKGKERKGRPVGRYMMAVQRRAGATQIAVLEGRNLIEHYVSRPNDDVAQIDGNIYLSKVQNVLPGMEAAFIDIGTPKNAVLYRGDVRNDDDEVEGHSKPDNNQRIEDMIKTGQVITTQVTKNPIGLKGARLTQEVSLPGRFVVLMPDNSTYGISKRLPDDERKRLRKVLDEVKPAQHGIIVRTAAEGVTAEELRRDVKRLVRQWDEIAAKAAKAKAPALLYREPDMAVRIIREEFNKNYRGVVIDDKELFEEVKEYVSSISPELADRIEYFDREAEPLPLFERYHVHEQLHKALDRKVWLPSGGSLIIERTEALTVIDVNTGKNVGTSNLEATVFDNNLEAADEIAHQLRLRDIGGIIVIDFIDMEIKKNRDEVLNRLRDALARDKTRTQAYPIGELGLVEMTRKRISEGLVESFSEPCPECQGRGFILDEELLSSK